MISTSNSSGVNVLVFNATTFGSSVWAHGLATISWSRTARAKIECSMVWYLRIDRADSPPAAAWVTQSCTRPGVIWCSCLRPKNGKKCLVRFDTYAARVVGSMCLDGSHSVSTYSRNRTSPREWSRQEPASTRCSSRLAARWAARWVEKVPAERCRPSGSR